jgi:hypothetical protein
MKKTFESYLEEVRYRDWDFNVHMDGERAYLQVGFWDYDATLPPEERVEKSYQQCRKWFLSPHMTKSEVIQTAFKAILSAEEHETRERFTYRGKAIFGPHFHVDALAAACHEHSFDLRQNSVAMEMAA